MITRNLKRWLALPLLLGAILYACQSEDSPDLDTKQPVEPLTVAMAQSLYQQYVGTTAYLKNDDGNGEFNLIPDWNAGQLFSDSNWYVVESPLELGEDRELVFSTAEVKSHDEVRPYSIVRQVVMRNKHTGLDYAFVMIMMPTWEYMQKGKDRLYGNQYLTRAGDLSGEVIFLDTKGEFINGWRYSNGEITHAMIVPEQQLKTVWRSQYCWHQDGYVGEKLISSNYICIEWHEYDQTSVIDEGFTGSGEVNYTDPLGTGGNNGSPDNSPSDDKKPETRTDCSPSAAMNASNAESAMKGNADITSKMSTLRNYVGAMSSLEYGFTISYYNGSYSADAINKEIAGSGGVGLEVYTNTVYNVHTHTRGENFTGPSVTDINFVLRANEITMNALSNRYQGQIILLEDGSECLISVNDKSQAKNFQKNNPSLFEDGELGGFKNTKMRDELEDLVNEMEGMGYSEKNAYIYALSHMLDKYNTGLKISVKDTGKFDFKETKAEYNSTKKDYKLSICK